MAPTPLITTRFDATSTAVEVVHGVDLSGRRALVTGASSGIGAETALALAVAGAAVTLGVRNVDAGLAVADRIAAATGGSRPQVRALDLADPASVASLIRQWDAALDILVNNAGLVTAGLERTRQGWELQFATNHLGHFALALGLQPHLAAAADARGGARIVALSSTAHMRAPVANAVNPGGVATGLQRNFSSAQRTSLDDAEAAGVFTYKTVAQGAATTLVAAIAPEFAEAGGRYLDDCREAYTVPDEATLAEHPHGVKQWALDPEAANQLWHRSFNMVS